MSETGDDFPGPFRLTKGERDSYRHTELAMKMHRQAQGRMDGMTTPEENKAAIDAAYLAGQRDERRAIEAIVQAQPYYPDTKTGMRQQWVKDQILSAIRARDTDAITPGSGGMSKGRSDEGR